MNFNADGERLIKEFEGCKLQSYRDVIGILTIGYGHTGQDVRENMFITQDQAEVLLMQDIRLFVGKVTNILYAPMNDNQFSATVCFAYNVKGWASTPLFGYLLRGEFETAQRHWLFYDKVTSNGQKIEVPGLKRRRQAELDLFCKAVNS